MNNGANSRDRRATNRRLELLRRGLLAHQKQLAELLVHLRHRLDQLLPLLRRQRFHVLRHRLDLDVVAVGSVKGDRLVAHQIHHPRVVLLQADGHVHRRGVEAELLANLLQHLPGVGARAVALVDEAQARDGVATHLSIDGDGLRLDAADGTEHEDGAVEDAERALDLDGEVDVAGGVDDVDVGILPFAVRRGGLDCDAPSRARARRIAKSIFAPTPSLPRTSAWISWMRPV